MADKKQRTSDLERAKVYNQEGLVAYADWDIDTAAARLRSAIEIYPDKSEFYLNLAKILARGGDFDQALQAIAEFLRLEPNTDVADRFMQLFASGLDPVESTLTEKMTGAGVPIEEIGAAMQMWLEFRITIGRESLSMRKPQSWSAGLDYTVRKVNLRQVTQREVADLYRISQSTLRDRFDTLVTALDVMPCDYRYFVGEQNPLDKLVEAAELLEQLETRFREP